MEGRRGLLPNLHNIGDCKEQAKQSNPESNFITLEDTLRELIATNNGNSSNAMAGESLRTGGPPPAKPFSNMLPANTSKPLADKTMSQQGKNSTGELDINGSHIDPIQHKLAEDCAKEEHFIIKKRLSEFKPCKETLLYLSRNDVRPLKKKSQKFPQAIYYCRICDYHCDNLSICVSHIKDVRHNRLIKMQELETTLFHLPKPGRHHLDSINQLLLKTEKEQGLPLKEIQCRKALAVRLTNLFQTSIPGCTVRLYGSSLTGFGLIDSGLNLDLLLPDNGIIRPHIALINAYNTLSEDQCFENVQNDFSAKIPVVTFEAKRITSAEAANMSCSKILPMQCELSLNNHNAFQTSQLLADYCSVDHRVRCLGVCLRYWAKICKVDRQSEGTLPSHSFPILLIHFLQQEKKPIVPCIHDYLISESDSDVYKTPIDELQQWKTRNFMTVGELWIEFFEYYALGFNMNENVVSIRKVGGYTRQEKQWKGKKLVVEDPFSTKRSLTRSVNSLTILDFINDCFKMAYLYFGTIQTINGPVITKIIVPDSNSSTLKEVGAAAEETEERASNEKSNGSIETLLQNISISTTPDSNDIVNSILAESRSVLQNVTNVSSEFAAKAITAEEFERALLTEDGYFCPQEGMLSEVFPKTIQNSRQSDEIAYAVSDDTLEAFIKKYGTELSPKQAQHVEELVPKNMIAFIFDAGLLTGGQSPALICTICGLEGHLQTMCPDEKIPILPPLPFPLSGNHQLLLDRVCEEVMHDWEPKNAELLQRKAIVEGLSNFIVRSHPNAILTVFGSSVNGFAFAKSDLDISLTFRNYQTDSELDAIGIIEVLADRLKNMHGIRNIQAITSAKVPIIKFLHYETHVEGDISLYNILAQENTRMLRFYSLIDIRVRILGYMVKLFAKICDIGDASRGSLSSYAYILMLIHYLQRCVPPVIPVLQELYPGRTEHPYEEDEMKPKRIVDGWNAWFFDDMERLVNVWTGFGENRQSVGTLWLGFLDYYARCFDDKNEVVCIRQSRTLSKFEKMWNSPCIAIEDPFDLSHNLGAGISRKMNLFIKKAFVKTRNHFGFLPQPLPCHYKTYLFDPNAMTDGNPPNDRGCRACGKIGHLVRDCPRKKNSDDRKKREQKEPQSRERQPKESTGSNGALEGRHARTENIESLQPEKFQHQKTENEHDTLRQRNRTEMDIPTTRQPIKRDNLLNNQANPLLSMLSNLGMNVEEIDSSRSVKHLLPTDVNVISAEELEKQLRNPDEHNAATQRSVQNFNLPRDRAPLFGSDIFQRPSGLINPPPGFLPPTPEISLSNVATTIPPSTFQPFGRVALPPPVFSPGNLHIQSPILMPSSNNMASRFPVSESLHNNLLPTGNVSTGNFTHSSPFGLGLSIGGLEHMIGKQQSAESSHSSSNEISNSGQMNYATNAWSNFPVQQENARVNMDTHTSIGSPNSSMPSFPIPLERLFNMHAIHDQVYPTSENSHTPGVSAPWPPSKE